MRSPHISPICWPSLMPPQIFMIKGWTRYRVHGRPFSFGVSEEKYLQDHRNISDELGKKLGFKHMEDWYRVTKVDFLEFGGALILDKHFGSISWTLRKVYPHYKWMPWRFGKVEKAFWNFRGNERDFILWLVNQLGFKEMDEWYNITKEDIIEYGGEELLANYQFLVGDVFKSVFPNHNWNPWRFGQPHGFWSDKKNQRGFFQSMAEEMKLTNFDQWYSVTTGDVLKRGGSGTLSHYNNSISLAISSIFPENDWLPWRFQQTPKGFWSEKKNQLAFMKWVERNLFVMKPEDWYRISIQQISKLSPTAIFRDQSLYGLLQIMYPTFEWNSGKLVSPFKASQRFLAVMVKDLFPGREVLEDYSHSAMSSQLQKLTLDVFIPSLQLAFEYNGEQHYFDCWAFGPQWTYAIRGAEKRRACLAENITLIEVPYWWNLKKESLMATIYQHRPGVIEKPSELAVPIPKEPPFKSH